eukprot:6213852-Pleurochrysis_carterae.AAC.2
MASMDRTETASMDFGMLPTPSPWMPRHQHVSPGDQARAFVCRRAIAEYAFCAVGICSARFCNALTLLSAPMYTVLFAHRCQCHCALIETANNCVTSLLWPVFVLKPQPWLRYRNVFSTLVTFVCPGPRIMIADAR